MYAAPPEITADVFTRLPDGWEGDHESSPWAVTQHPGGKLRAFLEGPSFDRDGNLWLVDIAFGRVFKVSPDGEFTIVADYDGEPNGLKFHKDGRIFIADHKNGIVNCDPETGEITPYIDRPYLERFMGTNDLHFTKNGDLYFTDQGQSGLHDAYGKLYRVSAEDGRLEAILSKVPSPNGLVTSLDERQIMLAVTRANAIWRVRFHPDGKTVAKTGTFIQLSGGGGPDGVAMDEKGNLVVCHVGMGSVWLFSPLGEPLLRIRAPEGLATTNAAFGGPDGKTLFITESETATVLKVDMPHAGAPIFGLS
ncbi:MAG: gluconolactonase [Rhodospirillaceae bacterium]|nr:gluconolactonase [Rhodospirillaceae bacterium]